MVAVDTNILVYAHREELPKHKAAKRKLKELAEGEGSWFIPVFCIGEFLRVISHPKLFTPSYSAEEAVAALNRILLSPSLEILLPGPNFTERLKEAIEEGDIVGNLIFDAQIVALCRERGVKTLLTEDRDFARFSGLNCIRV